LTAAAKGLVPYVSEGSGAGHRRTQIGYSRVVLTIRPRVA
jgi:hypothetical protein